jgi:hypothetical protein
MNEEMEVLLVMAGQGGHGWCVGAAVVLRHCMRIVADVLLNGQQFGLIIVLASHLLWHWGFP